MWAVFRAGTQGWSSVLLDKEIPVRQSPTIIIRINGGAQVNLMESIPAFYGSSLFLRSSDRRQQKRTQKRNCTNGDEQLDKTKTCVRSS